jgi:hypothetical protein
MVNLLNPLTVGVNTFPLMEPYALSVMPPMSISMIIPVVEAS